MRDILFRGKPIGGGEWVEGCYVKQPGYDCITNELRYTHFIYKGVLVYSCLEGFEETEVVPETVGQYTGLTDKNEKKIFEGDIVKCTDALNGIEFMAAVLFGNPNGEYNWGFQLKKISGDDANTDILLWAEMEESGAYIEVIGNVFDNFSEGLKGETT